jgi:DNA-binding XRE family transcriptional regulator
MKNNLLEILRGEKSQAHMASKYSVSQQTWSSWEKGRTIPENKLLLKMENDFEIPMEVIFFGNFNYKCKLKSQSA